MGAPGVGFGVVGVVVVVAGLAGPAVGDRCLETERDERGKCPVKAAPASRPRQPVKPAPARVAPGSCPAEMVRVPAGTFQMGSDQRRGYSEYPAHQVTLSAYCIDRTEVTVKAYAACVAARGCPAPPRTVRFDAYSVERLDRYSRLCNGHDRAAHPINCVDWSHAAAYCAWAGKRLPTEAEWEYAARGRDGRSFPWGNEPPSEQRLNACGAECSAMAMRRLNERWREMYSTGDGWETTAPAGSFPSGASPFGALDMAGNVWEWTADYDGPYAKEPVTDPKGAPAGHRVFRGGGWNTGDRGNADAYRVTTRRSMSPAHRLPAGGFRCARGD